MSNRDRNENFVPRIIIKNSLVHSPENVVETSDRNPANSNQSSSFQGQGSSKAGQSDSSHTERNNEIGNMQGQIAKLYEMQLKKSLQKVGQPVPSQVSKQKVQESIVAAQIEHKKKYQQALQSQRPPINNMLQPSQSQGSLNTQKTNKTQKSFQQPQTTASNQLNRAASQQTLNIKANTNALNKQTMGLFDNSGQNLSINQNANMNAGLKALMHNLMTPRDFAQNKQGQKDEKFKTVATNISSQINSGVNSNNLASKLKVQPYQQTTQKKDTNPQNLIEPEPENIHKNIKENQGFRDVLKHQNLYRSYQQGPEQRYQKDQKGQEQKSQDFKNNQDHSLSLDPKQNSPKFVQINLKMLNNYLQDSSVDHKVINVDLIANQQRQLQMQKKNNNSDFKLGFDTFLVNSAFDKPDFQQPVYEQKHQRQVSQQAVDKARKMMIVSEQAYQNQSQTQIPKSLIDLQKHIAIHKKAFGLKNKDPLKVFDQLQGEARVLRSSASYSVLQHPQKEVKTAFIGQEPSSAYSNNMEKGLTNSSSIREQAKRYKYLSMYNGAKSTSDFYMERKNSLSKSKPKKIEQKVLETFYVEPDISGGVVKLASSNPSKRIDSDLKINLKPNSKPAKINKQKSFQEEKKKRPLRQIVTSVSATQIPETSLESMNRKSISTVSHESLKPRHKRNFQQYQITLAQKKKIQVEENSQLEYREEKPNIQNHLKKWQQISAKDSDRNISLNSQTSNPTASNTNFLQGAPQNQASVMTTKSTKSAQMLTKVPQKKQKQISRAASVSIFLSQNSKLDNMDKKLQNSEKKLKDLNNHQSKIVTDKQIVINSLPISYPTSSLTSARKQSQGKTFKDQLVQAKKPSTSIDQNDPKEQDTSANVQSISFAQRKKEKQAKIFAQVLEEKNKEIEKLQQKLKRIQTSKQLSRDILAKNKKVAARKAAPILETKASEFQNNTSPVKNNLTDIINEKVQNSAKQRDVSKSNSSQQKSAKQSKSKQSRSRQIQASVGSNKIFEKEALNSNQVQPFQTVSQALINLPKKVTTDFSMNSRDERRNSFGSVNVSGYNQSSQQQEKHPFLRQSSLLEQIGQNQSKPQQFNKVLGMLQQIQLNLDLMGNQYDQIQTALPLSTTPSQQDTNRLSAIEIEPPVSRQKNHKRSQQLKQSLEVIQSQIFDNKAATNLTDVKASLSPNRLEYKLSSSASKKEESKECNQSKCADGEGSNLIDTGRSLETIAVMLTESQLTGNQIRLNTEPNQAPLKMTNDCVLPDSSLDSFKRFLNDDNQSSDSLLVSLNKENDSKDLPLQNQNNPEQPSKLNGDLKQVIEVKHEKLSPNYSYNLPVQSKPSFKLKRPLIQHSSQEVYSCESGQQTTKAQVENHILPAILHEEASISVEDQVKEKLLSLLATENPSNSLLKDLNIQLGHVIKEYKLQKELIENQKKTIHRLENGLLKAKPPSNSSHIKSHSSSSFYSASYSKKNANEPNPVNDSHVSFKNDLFSQKNNSLLPENEKQTIKMMRL